MKQERAQEILAIAKFDYGEGTAFIQRLQSGRLALRTAAIAITTGTVSLGASESAPLFPALAVGPVALLAFAESSARLHYEATRAQLLAIEELFNRYKDVLADTGVVAEMAGKDFVRDIRGYQFGVVRGLRPPKLRARIRWMVTTGIGFLYLLLIGTLAVTAVLVQDTPTADDVCLSVGSQGDVVRFSELPAVLEGTVTVVDCSTE